VAFLFELLSTYTTFAVHFPHGPKSVSPVQDRQQGVIDKIIIMPKVKTNSSAKKRFKVTGTGEITYQKAFKRHILTKKSTKRKRAMRQKGLVGSTNKDFVLRLLRLKG
jgi:large subunit ribosomal protein L35